MWKYTLPEITDVILDYFSGIYSSSNLSNFRAVLHGLNPRFLKLDNANLTPPISREEIKRSVFSINLNKALGDDGLTGLFFQKYWGTIGDEVR